MLSAAQNDLITRITPGKPAGNLLRRYWQPAALAVELEGARPIRPVRLLGQDLVLFRDEAGQLGLLDRDCPHRNADLAFGRLEDGGLRCPFHGWLFDRNGHCLQTPAEPKGSRLCKNIRQKSYPVVERSGIIFAYLGEGEPPEFPALDCFLAPEPYVFAFKGLIECNWLQALEVGMDPAHASFLHRFFEDEKQDAAYGRQFRATSADSEIPMTQVLREFPCPDISVESMDYGLRIIALREINEQKTHVRVTNVLFPQAFVIPLSGTMTITQWHVPIDDTSCYWYAIFTSFDQPVDKETMRDQRLKLYTLPDYRPRIGRFNDYGFDPYEQAHQTYTGMGEDINVHDQWAIESQGRIQDRTREHLGQTDKAIIAFRRLLMTAIRQVEEGEKPIMVLDGEQAMSMRGPATMDGVGPTRAWQEYWRNVDQRRRVGAPWACSDTVREG
ncbi:aromatic ring-hydroxylating dioxygenase subunit alpha [Gluconacetobacter tumulicola]|uniref:Aromatic ring-hydroxylating dioxygenase subunit alpha n=1 Tax=Gluconacetobacter tumulicola TaxID=1017177 RepID=A0A7W4P9Y1_9PROT|nr:aromatic ring-hydroxylating dioxygenase subunit alpha [Gluconacetobacter tumulicola]MBB2180973.1 aromatic ring-hydroxylating dioxygenase subunit alpha [Gluconacetobacter tumulicola]